MTDSTYIKDNGVKQLIVRVEPELKQKFYMKCIENNTSMQEVLNDFIDKYIKEN